MWIQCSSLRNLKTQINYCLFMKKILFVCLGNICRSSTAEEVFRTKARENNRECDFEIDSAGILGCHSGELPDSRMRMHAQRRGYNLTHRSRQVTSDDFFTYDMIIAMDDRNVDDLKDIAPTLDSINKIYRMTDFCIEKVVDHVPDPYYGGDSGFENVLDILEDSCKGLLDRI